MRTEAKLGVLLAVILGLQGCTALRAANSVPEHKLTRVTDKKCLTRRDIVKTVGKPDRVIRHSDGAGRVEIHNVTIRNEHTPGAMWSLGMSVLSLGITELSAGVVDGVNAIEDKESCNPTLGAACEYRKERWYVHYGAKSKRPFCIDQVVLRKGAFQNAAKPSSSCNFAYKRNLAARLSRDAFVDMASDGQPVRARIQNATGTAAYAMSDQAWRNALVRIEHRHPCARDS